MRKMIVCSIVNYAAGASAPAATETVKPEQHGTHF
jgi:hypothetical protein